MTDRHAPLLPGFPSLLHGGDWNPDQWLDSPAVVEEDHRLMGLAGVNAVSVGIFAWAALEPEEGRFEFSWLDRIMDRLARDGRKALLATPSGSKPAWMSLRYPEVCRLREGRREPHQSRHNHCFTSPIYRAKVREINTRLAERYGRHPGLGAWHLSNEYNGDCQCPLCWEAFRAFLRRRHGDLAGVNRAWYTTFWGHTFTTWEQINQVDVTMHAMVLDWRRFVTEQTADFIRAEAEPLRRIAPGIPVTTNFMGPFTGLDYTRIAQELDWVAWDAYPDWHNAYRSDLEVACETGFWHDLVRGTGGQTPWLLMESTPSSVNWKPHSRPKVPGMHRAASLQALAHGSDGVLYFQMRKSRGCSEKMHGAVIDHVGHERTRVFREVSELGATLARLASLAGLPILAEAAVVFDVENAWAIDEAGLSRNIDKDYRQTCVEHYRPLFVRGITTDVIDQTADLARYRLLLAPMSYLLRPGFAERLQRYVEDGGILVATYLSGLVDQDDQCFQGGFPGPLRQLFGIWAEESDTPADNVRQSVEASAEGARVGLSGSYAVRHWCDRIHPEGAEVLATYASEWYAGTPAVTRKRCGHGEAWYVAARGERRLVDDVIAGIAGRLGLTSALANALPEGVIARVRGSGAARRVFVLNFSGVTQDFAMGPGWCDAESATVVSRLELARYDARVLKPM